MTHADRLALLTSALSERPMSVAQLAAALRWPSCAEATLAVYRAALGGSSSLRRTLRISQPSTGMRS